MDLSDSTVRKVGIVIGAVVLLIVIVGVVLFYSFVAGFGQCGLGTGGLEIVTHVDTTGESDTEARRILGDTIANETYEPPRELAFSIAGLPKNTTAYRPADPVPDVERAIRSHRAVESNLYLYGYDKSLREGQTDIDYVGVTENGRVVSVVVGAC